MSIPYWGMADPWNSIQCLDEFGAGTLDGLDVDGPSYDACGPAAIENAAAVYEHRAPTYENIGHIRADMIANGDWTEPVDVSNPRTGGCTLANLANEIPRRNYAVTGSRPYQDAVLTEADVREALSNHDQAILFIVTNAQALIGNEHGVQGHFVVVACYGGDNADGSTGKLYILNSDIAGQHGLANGQWTDCATLLAAQPHGWLIMAPPPPPAPPAPAESEGAEVAASQQVTVDLQQLQQMVEAAVAKALADNQAATAGS